LSHQPATRGTAAMRIQDPAVEQSSKRQWGNGLLALVAGYPLLSPLALNIIHLIRHWDPLFGAGLLSGAGGLPIATLAQQKTAPARSAGAATTIPAWNPFGTPF